MNNDRHIIFREIGSIKVLKAISPAAKPGVTILVQEEGYLSMHLSAQQCRELGLWLQSEGNKLPPAKGHQLTWWGRVRQWLTGAAPE